MVRRVMGAQQCACSQRTCFRCERGRSPLLGRRYCFRRFRRRRSRSRRCRCCRCCCCCCCCCCHGALDVPRRAARQVSQHNCEPRRERDRMQALEQRSRLFCDGLGFQAVHDGLHRREEGAPERVVVAAGGEASPHLGEEAAGGRRRIRRRMRRWKMRSRGTGRGEVQRCMESCRGRERAWMSVLRRVRGCCGWTPSSLLAPEQTA